MALKVMMDGLSLWKFSHSSTVYWGVIPIFSFWKPYQALKEILLKTAESLKDKYIKTVDRTLSIYWLIWVLLSIYSTFIFKYYMSTLHKKIEWDLYDYQFVYANTAIKNILDLILIGCLFYYVKHVNNWQQNNHKKVSLQKTS